MIITKRLVAGFLAACLLLGVAGCGDYSGGDRMETDEETEDGGGREPVGD